MNVAQMRAAVLIRDGGCLAPRLDPGSGPCFDAWGELLRQTYDLEIDYIEFGAHGKRHELARDHVSLCAGHHRGQGPTGGRIWAKMEGRRQQLRQHLEGLARWDGPKESR